MFDIRMYVAFKTKVCDIIYVNTCIILKIQALFGVKMSMSPRCNVMFYIIGFSGAALNSRNKGHGYITDFFCTCCSLALPLT